MKTYVLYHANCWDGFCAAWVARKCLQGEVEYIPVQYGQEPPAIEPKSRLYIVDFSYSREQLFRWWTPGPNAVEHLVVLDHHKTAQAALSGFEDECVANGMDAPKIVFDMEKSGGRLAWDHFFGNDHVHRYANPNDLRPWLVDYTEDRDLWKWALPQSREISAYIRSYPLDFGVWDEFANYDVGGGKWASFVEAGAAILRSEAVMIENHIRHAREIELGGHKILAVNATVLFSDIAGKLAEGRPFGAAYFDRGDGRRQWSLRSTDAGVDVSAVAKSRGGGGHRNAAGFEETGLMTVS